jgi:hypothetical protein
MLQMNMTKKATSLLLNYTNSTCEKNSHDPNIVIAVASVALLFITTFIGTVSNIAALQKIMTRNWRKHLSIIQLLITGVIVCGVLAPLQIIRSSLAFTKYEFLALCQFHHLLHLLADSCIFVSMVIISYERLRKIYKGSPHDSALTCKKFIASCSWLVVLPAAVYIIYKDNNIQQSISTFSTDCVYQMVHKSPRHLVESISAFFFSFTLVIMAIMYLLAICKLWKKLSNCIGSASCDAFVHSTTPGMILEPREATTVNMQVTDELFDSQTPTCSNYDSPSASRDNSIDIANYKQVLGQLQKRYADVHLKKNKQSETTLTSSEMLNDGQLSRFRKLSKTFLNHSKVKAKSSIATALCKMSNISLFSLDEHVENRCQFSLNPLKHTRRSAGNAWHEDVINPKNYQPLGQQQSLEKKKIPKKHSKERKQCWSGSIETCSDTYSVTHVNTHSDLLSTMYKTENKHNLDDGYNDISIIIEQPEPEIESRNSRKASDNRRKTSRSRRASNNTQRTFSNSRRASNNSRRTSNNSRRASNNSKHTSNNSRRTSNNSRRTSNNSRRSNNSKRFSTESKHRTRHYSMESEQGSSYNRNHSTENIQVSGTKQSDVQQFGDERRQLNSSTFKSVNDNSVLIHEGFKKIVQAKNNMTNPPNKTQIRHVPNRRKRKKNKKNKVFPTLSKQSANHLSSENRSNFNSSSDCSDICQEYNGPYKWHTHKSDTMHNLCSSTDDNLDWSDSSLKYSSRMSNSTFNLNSSPDLLKPQKKETELVDSMNEEELIIKKNESDKINEQQNQFPIIRIIGPNVTKSDQVKNQKHLVYDQMKGPQHYQNQHGNPQNILQNNRSPSTCTEAKDRYDSRSGLPIPMSPSMISLRTNNKSDVFRMIKRSTLIIMSLAIAYLPTCISVYLLDYISFDNGLFLLQISRSIQYLYFAIIPTVYVYTNQGLLKALNRTHIGS